MWDARWATLATCKLAGQVCLALGRTQPELFKDSIAALRPAPAAPDFVQAAMRAALAEAHDGAANAALRGLSAAGDASDADDDGDGDGDDAAAPASEPPALATRAAPLAPAAAAPARPKLGLNLAKFAAVAVAKPAPVAPPATGVLAEFLERQGKGLVDDDDDALRAAAPDDDDDNDDDAAVPDGDGGLPLAADDDDEDAGAK